MQISIGAFDEIVSMCEVASSAFSLPSSVRLLFASALRRTNRFRTALAHLRELLRLQNEPEVVSWEKGLCEARFHENANLHRQPRHPDLSSLMGIARFYVDQLDDEMALEVLSHSRFHDDGWCNAPAEALLLIAQIERRNNRPDSWQRITALLASESCRHSEEMAMLAEIASDTNLDSIAFQSGHPLACLRLADHHLESRNFAAVARCLRRIRRGFSVQLYWRHVHRKHLKLSEFTKRRLQLACDALSAMISRLGLIPQLLFCRANFYKAVGKWPEAADDFHLLAGFDSGVQGDMPDEFIIVKFDQLVYLNAAMVNAAAGSLDERTVAESFLLSVIRSGSAMSVDMMCLRADLARESGSSVVEVLRLYANAAELDPRHSGVKIGQIYAELFLGDAVNVAARVSPLIRAALTELSRRWRECYLVYSNKVIVHPAPKAFVAGDLLKTLEREFFSISDYLRTSNRHWRRLGILFQAVSHFRRSKCPLAIHSASLSRQVALVVLALGEAHLRDGAVALSRRALRIVQRIDCCSGNDLEFSLAVNCGSVKDLIVALHKAPSIIEDGRYPLLRATVPIRLASTSAVRGGDVCAPDETQDSQSLYDECISSLSYAREDMIDWRSQMLQELYQIRQDFTDTINSRIVHLKKRSAIADRRQLSYDLLQRSIRFKRISVFWAAANISLSLLSSELPDARLARAQLRNLQGASEDVKAAVQLVAKLHAPKIMYEAWQAKLVALRLLYGALLYRTRRYEDCEQVLTAVLVVNPNHQKALQCRSLCRVKLGQLYGAAEDLHALRHHRNHKMRFLLGQISLKLGRIDEAYECFRFCLAYNKFQHDPKLLLALGQTLVVREQYDEALVHLSAW